MEYLRAAGDVAAQMFPRLSAPQIARLEAVGRRRRVDRGEIIVEQGAVASACFVVISGQLTILQPMDGRELSIATLGEGQFTGEVSLVAGSSNVVSIRVAEAGELLEITLDALRRIVQVDAELSDILMRAFILRRAELIATGQGDIVLVGSRHSASTLRVREFLTRNGQPHTYLDADSDPGV